MDTADTCNMFIAQGPDDIVGHKTFDTERRDHNGMPILRHEPLTRAEADALWQHAKTAETKRAEQMPDEKAAIAALWDAHQRLRELGWREPQYCPKDGSDFKVIELGSTGIFDCYYQGKWPDGLYMVSDGGDIYPTSSGVAMFKLTPEAQAQEDARREELRRKFAEARNAD
ncbi:hypothetical protein IC762_12480 [Bradyrhizobium genosp. L]|uniref:hypothetical protein n=1 Tax=Bradyrhizobium genosp. L TaxID=83637 RepID=UPI0018A29754|nr:hypothetical protein [Bradyrhizobium genosp. L]QPF81706.1 hypothetical protein IC762_17950 [Bradyrhizobium genosp. L]QPF87058.1 hypothetical protein IC762_12480 [Bradyrhizobium genosp. L]